MCDGLSGLRLDGMSLQTCSATMSSMPAVQWVHVFSGNKIGIATLGPHLAALSSLQHLELSGNIFLS
jgi:hypothetical protein